MFRNVENLTKNDKKKIREDFTINGIACKDTIKSLPRNKKNEQYKIFANQINNYYNKNKITALKNATEKNKQYYELLENDTTKYRVNTEIKLWFYEGRDGKIVQNSNRKYKTISIDGYDEVFSLGTIIDGYIDCKNRKIARRYLKSLSLTNIVIYENPNLDLGNYLPIGINDLDIFERIKKIILAFLRSKELMLFEISDISMEEINDEIIDFANEIAHDDANIVLSHKMIQHSVEMRYKHKFNPYKSAYVKENKREGSCWLNVILDVYKKSFDDYFITKKLDYDTLAKHINENKPAKSENNGYSFNEVVEFFKKFKLGLCLLDIYGNIRQEYEPEKYNSNIQPKILYVIFHCGHIYHINHTLQQFCHIKEKKEKFNNECPKPSQNYFLRIEDEKNIKVILANSKKDIDNIMFNDSYDGKIYILYNDNNLFKLWEEYFNEGIKFDVNMKNDKLLFTRISLININVNTKPTKHLFISILDEDDVDYHKTFETQEIYNNYMATLANVKNNCISRNYISNYSNDVKDMIRFYTRAGLVGSFENDDIFTGQKKDVMELDFNKYYTSILYDLPFIPVVNSFDHFQDYLNDEIIDNNIYFVKKEILDNNYPFHHHNLCYGINIKGVQNIKIISYLSTVQKSHNFKEIIANVWNDEKLTETMKKDIFNHLIGNFNKKDNKICKNQIFKKENEVRDLIKNLGGKMLRYNKYFIHSMESSNELINGFSLISLLIYDTSHKKLFDLKTKVESYGLAVYSCNTDCLNVHYDFELLEEFKNDNKELFTYTNKSHFDALGKLKCKEKGEYVIPRQIDKINEENIYNSIKYINKINNINIVDEFNTLSIIDKLVPNTIIKALSGGCGKSTIFKNIDKTLFVVPYNNLLQNLQNEGYNAITVDKLLGINFEREDSKGILYDVSDYDNIVFDEICLNDISKLEKIKYYMSKSKKIFYATGDEYQNKPVGLNFDKKYYNNCIYQIFPNLIVLKYNKRCDESDREQMNLLCVDLRKMTSITDISYIIDKYNIKKTTEILTNENQCYYNKTCSVVNDITYKRIHPKNKYYVGLIVFGNGTKLLGKQRIYSNCSYKITKINENIELEDNYGVYIVNYQQMEELFRLPYARTGHSYQGIKINQPFTIFDIGKYGANCEWIYTAITRACRISDINIYVGRDVESLDTTNYKGIIKSHRNADINANRIICGDFITENWIKSTMKKTNNCLFCNCILDYKNFSVDRIDNNICHNINNCRIICSNCNVSKK